MLSVLESKGLVLAILFLVTFCLGLIPVKLMTIIQHAAVLSEGARSEKKLTIYKRVLSFLSCFAAGVFLATCFLDLLPEVRKKLTTALFEMNIPTGFPLAEFIMCWGLFFILIIEQIVLLVKESHGHMTHSPVATEKSSLLNKSADARTVQASRNDYDDELHYSNEQAIVGITDQPDEADSLAVPAVSVTSGRLNNYSSISGKHLHHDHDHSSHGHDAHFQKYHSPVRAFILLMAISLHSVFEGLAVGLQTDSGQVLGICAALVMHKSILSFSLGMNLVQSKLSKKVCVSSIFFFSITAPVGVALGIVITNLWQSTASNFADGVLQGIACGTFLFMTFFEVMPSEFNSSHDRMLKLLMLLFGFSVVTTILFFSDDVKAPFCKTVGGN